jgi:hypothetical protein
VALFEEEAFTSPDQTGCRDNVALPEKPPFRGPYRKPLQITGLKTRINIASAAAVLALQKGLAFCVIPSIGDQGDHMAKQVALYLRVSTDEQTLANQRRELTAAAERHGWQVVAEFSDAGISGSKGRDQRPGFDRLMKGIARREFDMVAAWSVDRLSRSLSHLVSFLGDIHAKGVGPVSAYARPRHVHANRQGDVSVARRVCRAGA